MTATTTFQRIGCGDAGKVARAVLATTRRTHERLLLWVESDNSICMCEPDSRKARSVLRWWPDAVVGIFDGRSRKHEIVAAVYEAKQDYVGAF